MKEFSPIPRRQMGVQVLSSDAYRLLEPHMFTMFDPDEIVASVKGGNLRAESMMGRFAAKVAVARMLHTPLDPHEVVVRNHPAGDPYIELSGRMGEVALKEGIVAVPVSIAHDHNVVVAFAAADTGEVTNLRVGVDVTLDRTKKILESRPEKVFTRDEINGFGYIPHAVKNRWAVKEAIAKVLVGNGNPRSVRWKTAEILPGNAGQLTVRTSGFSEEYRQKHGINEWHISTMRQGSASFAFVIAHA